MRAPGVPTRNHEDPGVEFDWSVGFITIEGHRVVDPIGIFFENQLTNQGSLDQFYSACATQLIPRKIRRVPCTAGTNWRARVVAAALRPAGIAA